MTTKTLLLAAIMAQLSVSVSMASHKGEPKEVENDNNTSVFRRAPNLTNDKQGDVVAENEEQGVIIKAYFSPHPGKNVRVKEIERVKGQFDLSDFEYADHYVNIVTSTFNEWEQLSGDSAKLDVYVDTSATSSKSDQPISIYFKFGALNGKKYFKLTKSLEYINKQSLLRLLYVSKCQDPKTPFLFCAMIMTCCKLDENEELKAFLQMAQHFAEKITFAIELKDKDNSTVQVPDSKSNDNQG